MPSLLSRRGSVGAAAASRLLFVVWFLARPDDPARVLGHEPSPRWRGAARAVAVRELVLGTGTVLALRRGRPAAGWLRGMAAADALDGSLIAVVGSRGTRAPRRVAISAASALAGMAAEVALARRQAGR